MSVVLPDSPLIKRYSQKAFPIRWVSTLKVVGTSASTAVLSIFGNFDQKCLDQKCFTSFSHRMCTQMESFPFSFFTLQLELPFGSDYFFRQVTVAFVFFSDRCMGHLRISPTKQKPKCRLSMLVGAWTTPVCHKNASKCIMLRMVWAINRSGSTVAGPVRKQQEYVATAAGVEIVHDHILV